MWIEALRNETDGAERAAAALAGVIASVGRADFGRAALECLNRSLPLGWWSVYRVFDRAPPQLHLQASFGVPDGTDQSWNVYRDGLYRSDRSFDCARGAGPRPAIAQWQASDLPAAHRERIYTRHRLRERVSLMLDEGERGVFALNLYRHESQPAFDAADLQLLQAIGLPLMAAMQLHIRLVRDTAPAAPEPGHPLAALPRREREVCDRLLRGWTHEGVAADLGLSAGTVRTYRDRAFERLGIRYRNELFARVLAHGRG